MMFLEVAKSNNAAKLTALFDCLSQNYLLITFLFTVCSFSLIVKI